MSGARTLPWRSAAATPTLPMPADYRILRHFYPAMIEPGAVR
jgi:hypothetical protein